MNKAFAVNGFVRRYRWTLLRRATELLVLICFTGTARWGWEVFGKPLLVGDLSSSRILGVIPLDDPLALFERLCAGIIPTASAAVGALLITLFYGLLGSRTFCGWVCPMNFVVETAAWLRRKLNLPADAVRLPRLTRYATLAGVLLASILTGSAAFEAVSPQAFLWRDIIFGTGLSALSAVLTVFALELGLMKDGWCGHLCPLGAFWSLAGRASPRPILQIAFIDEHCTRCADCLKVCPEKQIIRFKELAQTGRIPSGDCLNCGRCIEICSETAFSFGQPKNKTYRRSIMTRSPLISVSVSAAAAAVLMALAMPASAVDSEIYGAPGLVPHPVKDYLPITVNKNMCVMCHKEQKGDVRVKGEIPKSHFTASGKLAGERYECLLCHAESSNAKPLAPVDPNDSTAP